MTWFLEDPIPTIVLAIAVEVAFVAALLLTGSRGALYGAIVVGALAGLLLVAERVVVTNREQIEALFDRAVEAVQAHDTEALVAMIDPQASGMRDQARRHLAQFRPQEVKITDLRIDVDAVAQPPTATADVYVVVTLRDGRYPQRVRVWLRKDQDQWFFTRYEARDLVERKH